MSSSRFATSIAYLVLVVTLNSLTAQPVFASGIAWDAKLYNPKPRPDDIIIPMPCGGAMAFRRVAVPTPAQPRDGFDTLIGPFITTDGSRYLLIGKYEVNRLQFAAVRAYARGEDCPSPTLDGAALALGNVSWQDASGFGNDYSAWLRLFGEDYPICGEQTEPCVPRTDAGPVPVRLPNEREWEYAARGGLAVSAEEFVRPLYPMTGSIAQQAWINSNARGEIQSIGRLASNPLGLHDLYGNVSEMMRDKRIGETRHGRDEVFVVRGGSRYSTGAELGADRAWEVGLYDRSGQVNTSATGFRVVIGAPPGGLRDTPERIASQTAEAPGEWTQISIELEPTPERQEQALALTREQRIEIQRKLNQAGFNAGRPDGAFGRRTRGALQDFQRSAVLESSGYLTLATQTALDQHIGGLEAAERAEAQRQARLGERKSYEPEMVALPGGTFTRGQP